jgi:hypothetical protein
MSQNFQERKNDIRNRNYNIFSKKVIFVTDSLPYEIDANKIARFRPCCEMSDFKLVDNTKEQI